MKLSAKDIPSTTGRDGWTDAIELAQGYSARVKVGYDDCSDAPWEQSDGHGPVSDWRSTESKAPGERVLCTDHGKARFYDWQEAVRIAKRDGWDAPPYKTGTKGEQAARAVEADFQFLREWCAGDWQYLVVTVEVSRNGEILCDDCCGGIEGRGDYWREHAADVAEHAINADIDARKRAAIAARKETIERRYWAARDVVTV